MGKEISWVGGIYIYKLITVAQDKNLPAGKAGKKGN